MNDSVWCEICAGTGQYSIQDENGEHFEDCTCIWANKPMAAQKPKKQTYIAAKYRCKHCNKNHDRLEILQCAVDRVERSLMIEYGMTREQIRNQEFIKKWKEIK